MGRNREPDPFVPGTHRMVLSGEWLFYLHDTLGCPLSISASFASEHGFMVDWKGFAEAARRAGWKERRLRAEIAEAFTTAYPMFLTREGFAKWLREHYEVADGDPSDLMACLLRRRPV